MKNLIWKSHYKKKKLRNFFKYSMKKLFRLKLFRRHFVQILLSLAMLTLPVSLWIKNGGLRIACSLTESMARFPGVDWSFIVRSSLRFFTSISETPTSYIRFFLLFLSLSFSAHLATFTCMLCKNVKLSLFSVSVLCSCPLSTCLCSDRQLSGRNWCCSSRLGEGN